MDVLLVIVRQGKEKEVNRERKRIYQPAPRMRRSISVACDGDRDGGKVMILLWGRKGRWKEGIWEGGLSFNSMTKLCR